MAFTGHVVQESTGDGTLTLFQCKTGGKKCKIGCKRVQPRCTLKLDKTRQLLRAAKDRLM